MKPKIVAVIDSSKFKDHHLGVAQRETLLGKVVRYTHQVTEEL